MIITLFPFPSFENEKDKDIYKNSSLQPPTPQNILLKNSFSFPVYKFLLLSHPPLHSNLLLTHLSPFPFSFPVFSSSIHIYIHTHTPIHTHLISYPSPPQSSPPTPRPDTPAQQTYACSSDERQSDYIIPLSPAHKIQFAFATVCLFL